MSVYSFAGSIGSSKILKVMNRKYTREWYLDRIAAIRRILPECAISTDLFCGFHSETEEDFQETLSLMRKWVTTVPICLNIQNVRERMLLSIWK